jgi:hypothetical protein
MEFSFMPLPVMTVWIDSHMIDDWLETTPVIFPHTH